MKALLIYDGDCGFCTDSVRWLERRGLPGWLKPIPYQQARDELAAFGLTEDDAREAAYVLETATDGSRRVHRGAAAVNFALRHCKKSAVWRGIARLYAVPGLRQLQNLGYRAIAKNRHRMPGGAAACELPRDTPIEPQRHEDSKGSPAQE